MIVLCGNLTIPYCGRFFHYFYLEERKNCATALAGHRAAILFNRELEGIVMTETMGVAIGIGVLALVFIYLGCLMWKKEKITLLHSYHYDKVSPSDKKVFCKISGWGVIFVGIGLLVTAIIIGITDSALSFIAFALGFVVGLALLIYAGAKYNR